MRYEEPYRKRSPRRRRRRHPLRRLLFKLIALIALIAVGLYWLPVSIFMVMPKDGFAVTKGLPSSRLNILLLGVDAMNHNRQRSDSMMIASVGRGSVGLTSIQRDTLVSIDGHDPNKINAAFAFGGAELAARTVNQVFGTNIQYYVVADYTALIKLVDALGGIEVSISEEEAEAVNRSARESMEVLSQYGYPEEYLTRWGENVHLNGLQALCYARQRKIDSDFGRTARQRAVIDAMLQKLKRSCWNPVMMSRFVSAALKGIDTNMSLIQLISVGEKALLAGEIEQLRLPANGMFDDDGSSLRITDLNAVRGALFDFVYQ